MNITGKYDGLTFRLDGYTLTLYGDAPAVTRRLSPDTTLSALAQHLREMAEMMRR